MGSSVLVIKQTTSPSRNKPTHRSLRIPALCQDVLSESPCCCPDGGQPGPGSLPTEERDDSHLCSDLGRGWRLLFKRRSLGSPGHRGLVHCGAPARSDQCRS